jgi:hypothetical protein
MAVSPCLHHDLHPDSHQPDHKCAVKLLSEGQLDVELGGVSVSPPQLVRFAPLRPETISPVTPALLLPPGRAPPVSLP